MRLFEGITKTHTSPGKFFSALHEVISDLNTEYPPKVTGRLDIAAVRRVAVKYHVPIGGQHFSDPIHRALIVGRDHPTDAVWILSAFQNAWEHYQEVCRAEGRMAA